MSQTQGTQTAAAAAGGCGCSFFSCCAGCVLVIFLGSLLVVGGLAAAYHYLPAYVESKMAEAREANKAVTTEIFAKAKRNPAALPGLKAKVQAFTAASDGPEAGPAELVLGEGEVNAWIAETLLGSNSPLPLQNAAVSFQGDRLHAAVRARGPEIAAKLPKGDPAMDYARTMLMKMENVDLSFSAKMSVKNDRASFELEQGTLGPFQLWPSMVNPLAKQLLEENLLRIPGVNVQDLSIRDGKLHVKVKRRS